MWIQHVNQQPNGCDISLTCPRFRLNHVYARLGWDEKALLHHS